MRRVFLMFVLLFPTIAFAQRDWVSYPDEGCIGGSTCSDRRLRVALQDRPVISVRFYAHDSVGEKAEGVLRLKIDGNTVDSYLDVPRAGKTFTVDVDELIGRYLVFEPVNNDEVQISKVQVLYGRETTRRPPRDPWSGGGSGGGRNDGNWRAYPSASGCIGGSDCRKNGTRLTIALEDAPVLGVRFYAHDNVGTRADGKLSVRIDGNYVASYVDVQRNGKRHEFDVDNVRGTRLVIEASNDDEVEVKDVEVLYSRARRGGGGGGNWQREATHEGGCIGGSECGGRRARIRIPIYGRSVAQVRFYARDDVGTRAGGELRIRIDDEVLQDYLDITREGRNYTFDGRGLAGDYIILEPASDDEIVIRDVRITFAPD